LMLLFGLRVYRETEIIKGSKRLELVSNIQAVAAARMVIANGRPNSRLEWVR
jgi:hypothetical protein